MKFRVLGRRHYDFQTNDGRSVKGWSIYGMYRSTGVEGYEVDKISLTDDFLFKSGISSPPAVLSLLDLDYDKKGKLVEITDMFEPDDVLLEVGKV